MLMEGERRNNFIANGHYSYNSNGHCGRFCNDYRLFDKDNNNNKQSLASPMLPSAGFIQHPVSRFDTLAGVAIMYGVEVADIKKMNGLVTDLQMFGLKSIQIPLPGRHPPSPCLSNASNSNTPGPGPGPGQNGINQTPAKHMSPDWLDSFQSLRLKSPRMVSPEMSSFQGYYDLKEIEKKTMSEAFEMAVYRKGRVNLHDGPFVKPSDPVPRLNRKCKSVANGFYDQNGEILVEVMSAGEAKEGEPDKSNEKLPLTRRRQKSEADFTKHLTLRMKGGIRMNVRGVAAKGEVVRFNHISTTAGDEYAVDGLGEVRKSSSTSCLHDHRESNNSNGSSSSSLSSLWPSASKLQVLSPRPIFDGLSARKNKAALD